MMRQPTSDINPYIQDGLIFWLDGKNKGGIDGKWVDLIGGVTWDMHDCIVNANSVGFNGTTSNCDTEDYLEFSPLNCTLEVCYKQINTTSNIRIIGIKKGGSAYLATQNYCRTLMYGTYNNNKVIIATHDYLNNIYLKNDNTLPSVVSCAVKQGTIILNGIQKTSATTDYYYAQDKSSLGCSRNYNTGAMSAFLNGEIYSIRAYNRQLTTEEILANQQADNERFNLGLAL